jgi:hypothetical protein
MKEETYSDRGVAPLLLEARRRLELRKEEQSVCSNGRCGRVGWTWSRNEGCVEVPVHECLKYWTNYPRNEK